MCRIAPMFEQDESEEEALPPRTCVKNQNDSPIDILCDKGGLGSMGLDPCHFQSAGRRGEGGGSLQVHGMVVQTRGS
eukprot:2151017-Amphidinium_carterae.1